MRKRKKQLNSWSFVHASRKTFATSRSLAHNRHLSAFALREEPSLQQRQRSPWPNPAAPQSGACAQPAGLWPPCGGQFPLWRQRFCRGCQSSASLFCHCRRRRRSAALTWCVRPMLLAATAAAATACARNRRHSPSVRRCGSCCARPIRRTNSSRSPLSPYWPVCRAGLTCGDGRRTDSQLCFDSSSRGRGISENSLYPS